MNLDKANPDTTKFGLHVTKDKLPGLHVEGNVQKTGNCKFFVREECRITADAVVKYSADANKQLTHKWKINREFVEQRPKYSYEHSVTHPSTNIQAKT